MSSKKLRQSIMGVKGMLYVTHSDSERETKSEGEHLKWLWQRMVEYGVKDRPLLARQEINTF